MIDYLYLIQISKNMLRLHDINYSHVVRDYINIPNHICGCEIIKKQQQLPAITTNNINN